MARLTMPVNSDNSHYDFFIDLEDITYNFEFKYNTRMDRWIMNISDSDLNPIIQGMALVLGLEYLSLYTTDRKPPGQLILFNFENEFVECGRNDLGNSCKLIYIESE